MPDRMPPLRILSYIRTHPWAMHPGAFSAMLEVVELRASGVRFGKAAKKARIEAARRSPAMAAAPGSIAILDLMGVMSQRMGMMGEISGGTSTERFQKSFQSALADPNVAAIVLNVDSPGGSVHGVQELANVIAAARGQKPVTAVANSQAASAAYWVASQADELVVCPGGEVGSIGVIACHEDFSALNERVGVKVTYITAPEGGHKAEGNPDEPLSSDAQAHLQGVVNEYYDAFVRAVAGGRKASLSTVREQFGKGRMMTAQRAVDVGMADRVATLQEVVDGLVAKQGKGRAKAESGLQEESFMGDPDGQKNDAEAAGLALARARVALAGAGRIAG
jgi:signal peptide peptidase SppA